jgi:hypothetical protein
VRRKKTTAIRPGISAAMNIVTMLASTRMA